MEHMFYGWAYPMNPYFLGGGSVIMFIGLILLVLLFYILSRNQGTQTHPFSDKSEKTPLDILKERYAKGEIDKKEFDEKKQDLTA